MTVRVKVDIVDEWVASVPPVPVVVQYYDDFSDSYNQITDADASMRWTLFVDGRQSVLDFERIHPRLRALIWSWCAKTLGALSPSTVEGYFHGLRRIEALQVIEAVTSTPHTIRTLWKQLHAAGVAYDSFQGLKNLLSFCCDFSVAAWKPEWQDFVSHQLPFPKRDKYAVVRNGSVFLTVEEEAAIVRHIDHVVGEIKEQSRDLSASALKATALLVCAYQFGLRPKQIAMLRMRDIRVWQDGVNESPAVHITFTMIKQRSASRVFPMIRKVKREWALLFVELMAHLRSRGLSGADHIFGGTPDEVRMSLSSLAETVLERRRTGMEFRHTAAQRLVDAGASEEELAAFMGHTDLNTGQMYYQASASQAERINQALGVSPVYRRVVKLARDRFISQDDLNELKGEQQVAGVPHGIPIAGIGGCSTGQPSCPYNPVLSCYGCNKFMPVTNSSVHESVLEDLRGIVKIFYAASRGERGSPAFQMEQTISNVQAVLDELGANDNELLP